jgi:molybdopterin-guanine dinucleotide biosynthesis protein A
MLTDVRTTTAIILAGGRSSRMGVDKASLLHEGQTFLQRVIAVAALLASEVLVVARPDSPVAVCRAVGGGSRLVLDERPNAGPLAGIEAGLRAMTWECAIVLSVDAPSTSPALLRALLCAYTQDVDVVLARTGRQVNGLVAVWGVSALAAVSTQLDAGSRSVQRAVAALRQRFVEPSVWRMADVRGRTFVNINTAQQYAERLVLAQGVDE